MVWYFYFRIAVLMYVTSALRLNFFFSNCQRLPSALRYISYITGRALGSSFIETFIFLIVNICSVNMYILKESLCIFDLLTIFQNFFCSCHAIPF